jgi:hypothetical protein
MNEQDQTAPTADFTDDLPWLGVHALTEFVYCARAGLVAHAKGGPDAGDELEREPWTSLSYSPLYDFESLNRAIEAAQAKLVRWGLLAAVMAGGAVVSFFRLGIGWLVVAFAAYLSCVRVWECAVDLAQFLWVRRIAAAAEGVEPDPSKRANQPVNWWAMIRAGFDSVPYGEGFVLRSETLRLAGRPWRVLRRGSLRIPVFKKRHCSGAGGENLHDQHDVRIAAYCRLLQECEQAESPYGIVLFDDSYCGVAISVVTAEARFPLEAALDQARIAIASWGEEVAPAPPSPSCCNRCPTGRPRMYRAGETETLRRGIPLPVFGLKGRDGRIYHSACGDHFRWMAPHERAVEKELLELEALHAAPALGASS